MSSHKLSTQAINLANLASKIHTKSARPDIVNQQIDKDELIELKIADFKDVSEKIRCLSALNMLMVVLNDGSQMGKKGLIRYYAMIFEALHPGFAKTTITENYGFKLDMVTINAAELARAFQAKDGPKAAEVGQEQQSAPAKVFSSYTACDVVFSGQGLPLRLDNAAIRCMCALLVYVIAKQPTQANFPASYHNRLRNFANMFAIDPADLKIMQSCFTNLSSFQALYGAMNWYVSFRVSVANEFFKWRSTGANNPNKLPVITIFNLLDGAGLKYIDLITTLIAAVPEVVDYVPFATYIPTLARALDVYSKVDPERVGYIRIIQHRSDKLPTSNDLSLIVACAKSYHMILQPTLGQYAQALSTQHAGAVNEFTTWLKKLHKLPEADKVQTKQSSVE
ncbi:hypothetical protein [Botrytis cinerea negative-stranded RNA virus 5]|uniref:Uncharacterized protein n=1 Tax=Botrytis cinerea negative-stranded RNA virus 5 TaxID=2735940 RepID=A0AAE7AM22_9MONO|nr:hypothetical protein QKS23_gp3 [Botrytis cinerea negative-stranded RNA virus 5]QJW39411.1 hypothetical protein [Botrytis cinerea negative-stranded RNA virus 5]